MEAFEWRWLFWFSTIVVQVTGSHFRGAIIMLQPTDSPTAETEMEISFHISWRRDDGYGGYCDESDIESGTLFGGGAISCQSGCNIQISLQYHCTDFSISENWSFGERRERVNFTDYDESILISYSGNNWISPFNSNWNIPTSMSLIKRNDTGKINSTPRAITSPVVRLQEGCNHTLTIAVSDPDNDIVRCRWAEGYAECGGVCHAFPGSVLHNDSCTLTYEAVYGTGMNIVAVMIEDFLPGSETPLSSVALQYLVDVYSSDELCSSTPQFIPPTLRPGSCVAIPPNSTYNGQLVAQSGGQSVHISAIETVSPAGLLKSAVSPGSGIGVYYVNITWKPEESQLNQIHLFCYTALNSVGVSSEQSCIQFMVGAYPPSIIQSSSSPHNDERIHPAEVKLYLEFSQPIQRPNTEATMFFKDYETNDVIYAINFFDSDEIHLVHQQNLTIIPEFVFPEKKKIYLEIEMGVVVGIDGCNPEIEPITDINFWTFIIRDVTPPQIALILFPSKANKNVTFQWNFNELAESICSLDFEEFVNCSSNIFQVFGLNEGNHTLIIRYTDKENNTANATHIFQVDTTAPNTTFISVPETISNVDNFIFYFTCDEPQQDCVYYCSLQSLTATNTANYSLCSGSSYTTPILVNEGEYLLSVFAVDSVNNVGSLSSYEWTVDLMSPNISIVNSSIQCSVDTHPNNTGTATVFDNLDPFPEVTFSDSVDSCMVTRTWTAIDEAGNQAQVIQIIKLLFTPSISLLSYVYLACSSASDDLSVSTETAMAPNPCQRPLQLSHIDNPAMHTCPGSFNRTWVLNDTCTGEEVRSQQVIKLYDTCPLSACGRNYSEPHGICSQGTCYCNKPWYGNDCDNLILEPKLEPEGPRFLLEGQDFDLQPNLTQGTAPIIWSISGAPDGTTIDYAAGRVFLQAASVGNFSFIVKATNQVGYDEIVISAVVASTYTVTLNPLITAMFPNAQPVVMTGFVQFTGESPVSNLLNGFVPVTVDIHNILTGVIRSVNGYGNQAANFSLTFYPAPSEYGSYEAWARHPSEPPRTSQIGWNVLGMRTLHSSLSLDGDTTGPYHHSYSNITLLINDGPSDLHMVQPQAIPDVILASGIHLNITFDEDNVISNFASGSVVSINIVLVTPGALYSVFPVVLQTMEGTFIYITITVNIKEMLPVLQVSPNKIDNIVIRGKQKVIDFDVTNVGKISAENVRIIIPDSSLLTLSSFGINDTYGNGLTLGSQDIASATLLIQVPNAQPLGVFSGNLLIQSNEAYTQVPYQILVASDTSMNLTIVVEDEYTYFAEGNPLVSDATINLSNYHQEYYMRLSTSENNGRATFVDIVEGRYELYVEAPGHSRIKLIIVTSFDTPTISVFLQRQAVTVTWTVTPVEVEDTYVITVEADFEVNVPMPVVTVTPHEIDLEEFELGLVDLIELNITNHGLIRAENVHLELPTEHPSLQFTALVDIPIHLEAKTSIILPVQVTTKPEERIGFLLRAQWIFYIINISYSYICGNLKIGNTPLILKKLIYVDIGPYNPQPVIIHPHSCRWCGSGGGGTTSGFSGHTSTTIDLCDPCIAAAIGCVKTPSFPGAGCIPLLAGGTAPDSFFEYMEDLRLFSGETPLANLCHGCCYKLHSSFAAQAA